MTQFRPPQTDRSVAVGLFDRPAQAQQATQALQGLGLSQQQVAIVSPQGQAPTGSGAPVPAGPADVSGLLAAAMAGGDLAGVLGSLGVPDGEARFYAREVQAGRSLVVVDAGQSYAAARDLLRRHGATDVESRGEDLVRGDQHSDGAPGGAGPLPADLTGHWQDVRSRYEMLFEQHFGTTDTTWEQAEPLYQYAWQAANAPAYRGRPWSEVEGELRRDWEASQRTPAAWSEAAGPIRDVWEDVAAEAATGAEGGAARRITRQGTDQAGSASDLAPPPGPA